MNIGDRQWVSAQPGGVGKGNAAGYGAACYIDVDADGRRPLGEDGSQGPLDLPPRQTSQPAIASSDQSANRLNRAMTASTSV